MERKRYSSADTCSHFWFSVIHSGQHSFLQSSMAAHTLLLLLSSPSPCWLILGPLWLKPQAFSYEHVYSLLRLFFSLLRLLFLFFFFGLEWTNYWDGRWMRNPHIQIKPLIMRKYENKPHDMAVRSHQACLFHTSEALAWTLSSATPLERSTGSNEIVGRQRGLSIQWGCHHPGVLGEDGKWDRGPRTWSKAQIWEEQDLGSWKIGFSSLPFYL